MSNVPPMAAPTPLLFLRLRRGTLFLRNEFVDFFVRSDRLVERFVYRQDLLFKNRLRCGYRLAKFLPCGLFFVVPCIQNAFHLIPLRKVSRLGRLARPTVGLAIDGQQCIASAFNVALMLTKALREPRPRLKDRIKLATSHGEISPGSIHRFFCRISNFPELLDETGLAVRILST